GMTEKLLRDFSMLWATVDPIGTMSLFVALTAGYDSAARRRIALKATLISAALLVGAIIAGQVILNLLGIQLHSFQTAGGIVLFLFGLKMVFEDSPGAGLVEEGRDIAVFPLALPSIASPGAIMAAVVLTDNARFSIAEQCLTGLMLLLVLAATWCLMLLAAPIPRLLGRGGAAVLVKIMGLILCALAVEICIEGIFGLMDCSCPEEEALIASAGG
ncbi:MAG: MarC family protein, partial [Terrimicrobiaceae bacterium]|nr:MarC family protein [Terrimicrobiaceae bacterium]